MVCRNGMQLAARTINGESIAARGFYSLFYQLSRPVCAPSPNHGRRSISRTVPTQLRNPKPGTTPPKPAPTPEELSTSTRHLMRSLPAPIVVLTTARTNTSYHPNGPNPNFRTINRGMTLSSFTTLSLSPDPLVTFNIRSPSEDPSLTLDAIARTKYFLVHVLRDNKEGARLAALFTKGNHDRGDKFWSEEVQITGVGIKGGPKENMPMDLPMLTGPGVRRVLRCHVVKEGLVHTSWENGRLGDPNGVAKYAPMYHGFVSVGDHVLIVARVDEILGQETEGTEQEVDFGLSYADGKYRRIGEVVLPSTEGEKTDV